MQVARKTKIIDKLTNLLKPIIKILFPEIRENKQCSNTFRIKSNENNAKRKCKKRYIN